jgi:hypothetical protein
LYRSTTAFLTLESAAMSEEFRKRIFILVLPIFCVLFSSAGVAACLESDKACLKEAQRKHPVAQAAFWQAQLAKPFEQRIGAAPPELVNYVLLDNLLNGFPERPKIPTIALEFRRDLDVAIAELPKSIRRALEKRLAGIYLVQSLGGSGYTDRFTGADGKPAGAYIILDIDVLSARKANEWATWKERTPFKPNKNTTLMATIETPENDNRKNAIQYILLHEIGHVLSVGRTIHPPWWEDFKADNLSQYHFASLSWQFSKSSGKFVTIYDKNFKLRPRVVYYLGAKLNADQAEKVYTQLEATNFPTLYAATNPFDDFAESFVTYVHTVMMKKPFEVAIQGNGKIIKRFGNCWETERCKQKRVLIEEMINGL